MSCPTRPLPHREDAIGVEPSCRPSGRQNTNANLPKIFEAPSRHKSGVRGITHVRHLISKNLPKFGFRCLYLNLSSNSTISAGVMTELVCGKCFRLPVAKNEPSFESDTS